MAGIDKAAIAFSIAIVAVGVGFAAFAGNVQDNTPAVSAPVMTKTMEPKTQADPFADIADKVKQDAESTTPEETVVEDETVVEEPAAPVEESSGPETVSVEIPKGTSSPGCETSNACFSPASLTINAGDTVEWTNTDTAAHTVTSGSPANGPSGVFDSSLIMGGASFENTFDEAGSYDYFCMVHPWMVGNIQVN
ncbi:MAG: cupredoxin domain-containing protein [Nitrosarchaeum sp.]|nr:cupredoxin domain-containing protein [Nitrosarchaeum sp.]